MSARVESVLAEQLPEASALHRQQLLALLSGRDPAGAGDVLKALLDDGCNPQSLHATLLYGRDLSLQQQENRDTHLRTTLLYYDRLVAMLMQFSARQLQSKLNQAETNLIHEGQKLLLTRARNRWLKEGVIELYNYFLEVPIIARVELLESRDDGITVERTEDVVWAIAAGEHGRYIQTRIPESPLCLRLEVQGAAGHKIHLRDAGLLQIARERRCHIRVQCDTAIPVQIMHPHYGEVDAVVQDYSEAGLGVSTRQRVDFRENDKVHIFMNMLGMEVDIDARICWVRYADEHTRLGLDMTLEGVPHIRQHLQRQVVAARRGVMSKLRMQGLPDCLLAL